MKRLTDEEIEKHLDYGEYGENVDRHFNREIFTRVQLQTRLVAAIVQHLGTAPKDLLAQNTYDNLCVKLTELTAPEQPAVDQTIQGLTQGLQDLARAERAEAEVKRLEEDLSTVQNSLATVVGTHTRTLSERDDLRRRVVSASDMIQTIMTYGMWHSKSPALVDIKLILRGETEGGDK
jgi:hypothetical protein